MKCQIRFCPQQASVVPAELRLPCSVTTDLDLEIFLCEYHLEPLSRAEDYVQGLAIPNYDYEQVPT